jgi:hypothetical protein
VTVTAKIYSAATSPSEAELAWRYLGDRAHIISPFDVTDYDTKLDIPLLAALVSQVHLTQTMADFFKTVLRPKLEMNLFARPVTTLPGDPALYRFVLTDDHATDPTPVVSVFGSLFGKPKVDDPLEGYEQYSQANWDGRNAEPITAQTLQYARRLLKVIPETLGPPDIAPSGDGSIGLEWVPEGGRLHKLFLDIGPGPEWRAYWNRNGECGRLAGTSLSADTRHRLQKLFNDLSR